MDFAEAEERDGVRFSWNVWPSTRIEASRLTVPVSCLYTPLKSAEATHVPYDPVSCSAEGCSAILNPHCQIDFMNKIWICPFCLTRNHFPHHYASIAQDSLPAELHQECTTIEYDLPKPVTAAPVFLFVIDTCSDEGELNQCKESLTKLLLTLPETSYVGLITFGKHVNVHQLGFADCPKSFIFRGDVESKKVNVERVSDMLGLGKNTGAGFIAPVSECELTLTTILQDLATDPWGRKAGERAARCTGTALGIGVSLLQCLAPNHNARICLVSSGAPCYGPGNVASPLLETPIRSHSDLVKGNAPFFDEAAKYYTELAKRCVANGYVVDIFSCALDQIGLAEMKVMVETTGGVMMICESFTLKMFTETFAKIFAVDENGELPMTFNSELSVSTSREFKIAGAIGSLSSSERKSPCVASELEIGVAGTSAWKMGAITPVSTVSVFFEIANTQASALADGRAAYLQFVTTYRHARGTEHVRVTTLAIGFADTANPQELERVQMGFDQEAACVLMARWAVYRTENEFALDVSRWLDRSLIKLVAKFANYTENVPESFQLNQMFCYFPQFVFHLRRSQFLQVFNASPDETAFYRICLQRESVANALTMIQPTLVAYTIDNPDEAMPVFLDTSSRSPDRILILDTFFHVVTWYGKSIAQWRDQGVQHQPDYEYFGTLLDRVKADAEHLMQSRMPRPTDIVADQGGSQARFLVAKLNPSTSGTTQQPGGYDDGSPPPVFTDDVSLDVFMQHLRKLAVQPK